MRRLGLLWDCFLKKLNLFFLPVFPTKKNKSQTFFAGWSSHTQAIKTPRTAALVGLQKRCSWRGLQLLDLRNPSKTPEILKKLHPAPADDKAFTESSWRRRAVTWRLGCALRPSRLNFQTFFWLVFPLKITKTRKFIFFLKGKWLSLRPERRHVWFSLWFLFSKDFPRLECSDVRCRFAIVIVLLLEE